MNFHPLAESRLHIGPCGGHENSQNHCKPFEDETLRFLSHEERECILFLEETINTFDHDFEEQSASSASRTPVGGSHDTSSAAAVPDFPTSFKEQDIIDLVQSHPDPPGSREIPYAPMPDFRTTVVPPEAHIQMKVRRDQTENQPAGSIPTPVVIAQKIAVHRGNDGPVARSAILGQRRSLDSIRDNISDPLPDHPIKQGPPTLAKPTRYPDNITMLLPSRDYSQTIARASMNVQQRQAQVLANLAGKSHTYELMEGKQERKAPNRSISFHDLAPNKSRMEALSKLGLARERNLSASSSNGNSSKIISPSLLSINKPSFSKNSDSSDNSAAVTSLSWGSKNNIAALDGKTKVATPSNQKADTSFQSVNNGGMDKEKPASLQLAGCGGKTKVVSPVPTTNSDISSHHASRDDRRPNGTRSLLGITETGSNNRSDVNEYGGGTVPPSNTLKQQDSKPIEMTSSLSSTSTASSSTDFNNYSSKSKAVPSQTPSIKPEASASNSKTTATTPRLSVSVHDAITRSLSFRKDSWPQDAPRPLRQSRTASFNAGQLTAPLSELRRRATSKPPFWHQGITVQFSGRGPTDESRREALRKLGLLKDTV